ncbi:OsmC family protein [Sphingomonas sp. ASV193]|uniref:OsmC family protein n=1 Tax=Sphingomonas sp. ASV193 TaxID=3144405 RepID=UPI0032E92A9E
MPKHSATVAWSNPDPAAFREGRYSRAFTFHFDGGAAVAGSASPDVVKAPWSDPAGVDPEEAFLASIASCHMLWFLDLAKHAGHAVIAYDDTAETKLVRSGDGKVRIETVTLHPRIAFADPVPDAAAIMALHEAAHDKCFIANSVSAKILIEPA